MRIERIPFEPTAVQAWTQPDGRHSNWPVVYMLNDHRDVYVGESINAVGRMRQHLDNPDKRHLKSLRVVLDDTFNKSVCLDLESFLIRYFAGDGRFTVLNRNEGITNADYYDRSRYRDLFIEIFEALRSDELFAKSIEQIENSDLFKLSPFKALNHDQEAAIVDILEGLFEDLESGARNSVVVQGGPGTGKTIVAIFMMKLLRDIELHEPSDDAASDSVFSDFFVEGHRELLKGFRLGLVVPQQSLRTSIKNVFKRTPGLNASMVMTPYEVARDPGTFDLLIVDETHRLTQYGSQSMGTLTKLFRTISPSLATPDEHWEDLTQLDWIIRKSNNQVFLLDRDQTVKPIDLPAPVVQGLHTAAESAGRSYTLRSQMRVEGGEDYLEFVQALTSDLAPPKPGHFPKYDLRFFEDLAAMRREIFARDEEVGLARLVAGYGWKWRSKKDLSAFDIELDGLSLRWNRTDKDWVNSPTSLEEVGSIHTVQGYDLNYAGVIFGPEIRLDPETGRLALNRKQYFDRNGKANNGIRRITYSDEDILALVRNVYRVLLTRGVRGTYIYVVDPVLRERMRTLIGP